MLRLESFYRNNDGYQRSQGRLASLAVSHGLSRSMESPCDMCHGMLGRTFPATHGSGNDNRPQAGKVAHSSIQHRGFRSKYVLRTCLPGREIACTFLRLLLHKLDLEDESLPAGASLASMAFRCPDGPDVLVVNLRTTHPDQTGLLVTLVARFPCILESPI